MINIENVYFNSSYFKYNLEIIEQFDKKLAKTIENRINKWTDFILTLKKLNINENYEIVFNKREVISRKILNKIVNKINVNSQRVIVLKSNYNFFILKNILNRYNFDKNIKNYENFAIIVIIEDIDIFIFYLLIVDLSFLKKYSQNILFLFDGTSEKKIELFLINHIKLLYKKPLIIGNPFYEKYFDNRINKLFNILINKINFLISDALTFVFLIYFQLKSILINLKKINKTFILPKTEKEIEILKKTLNKKVIIITAGYSISNLNFKKLKLLQKNGFYIIAVDTAYKILKYNNVIPDFTIIMDSQILNFYDFLFLKSENEIFVVDISSNHKIINKLNQKNKLLFFSSVLKNLNGEWSAPNVLAHKIINYSNLAKIPTFGNITLAAISFANYFFNEIYVLGFDRGFEKLIYHCKHSLDYYYFLKTQNYFDHFLSLHLKFSLKKQTKVNQNFQIKNNFQSINNKSNHNKNFNEKSVQKSSLNFKKLNDIFTTEFYRYNNIKLLKEKEFNSFFNNQLNKNSNFNNKFLKGGKKRNKYFLEMFETKFILKNKIDITEFIFLLKNSIELYTNFETFKFKKHIKKQLKNLFD